MAEKLGSNGTGGSCQQRYPLGAWKERITLQKSFLGNDRAENHVLSWEDYFSCSVYVNSLSGKEYWEAAWVNAQKDIYFIIRLLFGGLCYGYGALPYPVPWADI